MATQRRSSRLFMGATVAELRNGCNDKDPSVSANTESYSQQQRELPTIRSAARLAVQTVLPAYPYSYTYSYSYAEFQA